MGDKLTYQFSFITTVISNSSQEVFHWKKTYSIQLIQSISVRKRSHVSLSEDESSDDNVNDSTNDPDDDISLKKGNY